MEKKKKIVSDLIYCIGATGMMNVVLQFIVYPLVNDQIGGDAFGDMLFWLGVVSVLAPSFGLAVNNTRLVFPEREKTSNWDYVVVVLIFSALSAIIITTLCISQSCGLLGSVFLAYIMIASVFRNYSTVEYRLSLNYRKQFIFYLLLSVGYVIGVYVCWLTNMWFWVFVIGETTAVLYVFLTGKIYREGRKRTLYGNSVVKKCFILSMAYLLTNLMLNLDRIILKYGVGNEAVSQYYVLSLLGKTIAIIGGPLSSVIISYISKENYRLNKREFSKIVIIMICVGGIFLLVSALATPVYIKILYSNLYKGIRNLNVIVNAAQIFYFLTTLLLVIVLTICEPVWQLRIQIGYSVLFVFLAVLFTRMNGLEGFAIAAFISNMCFFLITVCVGMYFVNTEKKYLRKER